MVAAADENGNGDNGDRDPHRRVLSPKQKSPVGIHEMIESGDYYGPETTPRPDPTRLTTAQTESLRREMLREIAALQLLVETRLSAMDRATVVQQDINEKAPAMVKREVMQLKELMDEKLNGIDIRFEEKAIQRDLELTDRTNLFNERFNAIGARFGAMDQAIILQHEELNRRLKTQLEFLNAAIESVGSGTFQRFISFEKYSEAAQKGIQTQFEEREIRSAREVSDSKVAIAAALQAAKEAVAAQNESNALAMNKSEAALTKQIDAMNAIVATSTKALDDKISNSTKALDDKIGDTKDRLTALENIRKGGSENVIQQQANTSQGQANSAIIISIVGVGIAIIVAAIAVIALGQHHV